MSNRPKPRKKLNRGRKLDTVGVVGSIPIAPTIQARRRNSQIIEIPNDSDVIPAVSYRNGRFRLFLVITKKQSKKCEKSVNGKSRSRRSA